MRGVAQFVLGRGDQVLDVLVATRVTREREPAPGVKTAQRALAVIVKGRGVELLDPRAGVGVALGVCVVLAGVVVDLVVGLRVTLVEFGASRDLQVGAGALEVVVVVHDHPRLDVLAHLPVRNEVAFVRDARYRRQVRDRRLALDRGVRVLAVDQHHAVRTVVVLEEVVDPLLLHQPRHEVEVGLAILDAVLPRFVLAAVAQAVVDRLEALVGEHRVDDVWHVHRLEDPAVGGARQEPDPGAERHPVDEVPPRHAGLRETRDVAVEETRRSVFEIHAHRHALAEQRARIDVVLQAQHLEPVLEHPRQPLAHLHPREQQRIVERAGQFAESSHQRHSPGCAPPSRTVRTSASAQGYSGCGSVNIVPKCWRAPARAFSRIRRRSPRPAP